MATENTLLALLESREAEANAKAQWTAEYVSDNSYPLLAGALDTDMATLLAEADADQATQLNQAIYLLMMTGDRSPITTLIQQLADAALSDLAHDAWSNHLADLQDAMSAEQFEQYQHGRAA
ncbi:MAG: hypothetical protein ACRC8Q_06730 [Aeromonas sp.]